MILQEKLQQFCGQCPKLVSTGLQSMFKSLHKPVGLLIGSRMMGGDPSDVGFHWSTKSLQNCWQYIEAPCRKPASGAGNNSQIECVTPLLFFSAEAVVMHD